MTRRSYLTLAKHYEACFERFGDDHRGVDWPNADEAAARYEVMLDLCLGKDNSPVSLLDLGCGLSHFYDFIVSNEHDHIHYSGLEISKAFYRHCKKKYPENEYYFADILVDASEVPVFDYIVMNGVFTEKRELDYDEMFDYLKAMLKVCISKCNVGLAFNVMSKSVDWEREDLFHVSMQELSDLLSEEVSRSFVFRSDYGLYEYTAYVYKDC